MEKVYILALADPSLNVFEEESLENEVKSYKDFEIDCYLLKHICPGYSDAETSVLEEKLKYEKRYGKTIPVLNILKRYIGKKHQVKDTPIEFNRNLSEANQLIRKLLDKPGNNNKFFYFAGKTKSVFDFDDGHLDLADTAADPEISSPFLDQIRAYLFTCYAHDTIRRYEEERHKKYRNNPPERTSKLILAIEFTQDAIDQLDDIMIIMNFLKSKHQNEYHSDTSKSEQCDKDCYEKNYTSEELKQNIREAARADPKRPIDYPIRRRQMKQRELIQEAARADLLDIHKPNKIPVEFVTV